MSNDIRVFTIAYPLSTIQFINNSPSFDGLTSEVININAIKVYIRRIN